MSNLPENFDKHTFAKKKSNPFATKKDDEDETDEDKKPEDDEDETDETDEKPAKKPPFGKDNLTKGDPCWDGYKKVPGKADYADKSCVKKSGAEDSEALDTDPDKDTDEDADETFTDKTSTDKTSTDKTSSKPAPKKPKGDDDMDEDESPDAALEKHDDTDSPAEKSAVGMIEATDLFEMFRAVAEEGFQKGVAFASAATEANFQEMLEPLVKSALVKAIQEDDATKTAFRFIVGGRIGKEFAQYGDKMNEAVEKAEAAMEMVQKGILELDTLTKGALLSRDDVARTTPAKKTGTVVSDDVLTKGAYPDPSEGPAPEQDLLVKGVSLTAQGLEMQRKNRSRQVAGLSDAIAERDAKCFTPRTIALLEKSIVELSQL